MSPIGRLTHGRESGVKLRLLLTRAAMTAMPTRSMVAIRRGVHPCRSCGTLRRRPRHLGVRRFVVGDALWVNRTVRACTVLALQITTAFPVVEPGAKGASGELDDPPFAVLLSSASQSSRLASPSERQLWRTLLVRALEVPWEC